MPLDYRERTYGETKVRRWTDGSLLLKMPAAAAKRLKCL